MSGVRSSYLQLVRDTLLDRLVEDGLLDPQVADILRDANYAYEVMKGDIERLAQAKLDKSKNLADIEDVDEARDNLGVESVDTDDFLQAANNLSDVDDSATSATNLGLGTTDDVTHASLTTTGDIDAEGTIHADGDIESNLSFTITIDGSESHKFVAGAGVSSDLMMYQHTGTNVMYWGSERVQVLKNFGVTNESYLSGDTYLGNSGGDVYIGTGSGFIQFFGTNGALQQTVSGSRSGNAALTSLLDALEQYGLIVDSTT